MELSHVLFILMIVFFLGGAGLIRLKKRMSREIKDWHYTKGVIVRNQIVKRPRRQTAFPTVQYVVEEKTYEYTSDLAQNRSEERSVGKECRDMYNTYYQTELDR